MYSNLLVHIDKNIGKKSFLSDLLYHPLSSKCRNITHHESTTLWLNEPNHHCYPPLAPQSGAAATKNITSADYCATTKCRTKHHHYRRSYVSTARWMDHSFSVGPQLPLLFSPLFTVLTLPTFPDCPEARSCLCRSWSRPHLAPSRFAIISPLNIWRPFFWSDGHLGNPLRVPLGRLNFGRSSKLCITVYMSSTAV